LELVVLDMPLADVYADHWSVTGRDIPGGDTPDEAVYLPAQSAAADQSRLWCARHDINELAIGSLESNPFADATDEFFETFAGLLDASSGGSVRFTRPFAQLDKAAVMRLASPAAGADDVVP